MKMSDKKQNLYCIKGNFDQVGDVYVSAETIIDALGKLFKYSVEHKGNKLGGITHEQIFGIIVSARGDFGKTFGEEDSDFFLPESKSE